MTGEGRAPGDEGTGRLVVVLGSPNDDSGNLQPIALERLRRGAAEFLAEPNTRVLVTGGFGPHFNRTARPHAEYARAFLLSLGVPERAFTESALSGNTVEDALLARPIVDRSGARRLIVVTSDFHLDRARFVFDRVFSDLERVYSPAPHEGPVDAARELASHEARALARLRALEGSADDPLALG